jgi:50S ribosomal protein L16 3-hydroxylase
VHDRPQDARPVEQNRDRFYPKYFIQPRMTAPRHPEATVLHPMRTPKARVLGGMTPAHFLKRHWHRRAHLVRGAIPEFAGFLDRARMIALACRDDVESRLVVRTGRRWSLDHGPFRRRDFAALPARNWTLLVQGIDLHLDEGGRLLSLFGFVPKARLDDLMVSYAVPGGGVGPHFDSYDVFLLQGPGRRRWRIGAQTDLALRDDVPLKILKHFEPEAEHVLEPGDMLYLPPRYAHEGTAIDECLTYSIGFRAPAYTELAAEFLHDLADGVELAGRYADPGLAPTRRAGRLPVRLVDAAEKQLRRMRWQRRTLEEFLGRYLSEPKNSTLFAPADAPPAAALRRALHRDSIRLDRKSRLLYTRAAAYLNGEIYRFPRGVPAWIETLADSGEARIDAPTPPELELLRDWIGAGFVRVTGSA